MDELASISAVLQPEQLPWTTRGVADGEAASKLLQHLTLGGEAADDALMSLTVDTRPPMATGTATNTAHTQRQSAARGFLDSAAGGTASPSPTPTHFNTSARASSNVGRLPLPASPAMLRLATPTAGSPGGGVSPTSTFGGSSLGTARTAKDGSAEMAVLSAVHAHEKEVARLLEVVIEGAKEFRLAASYGQQNEAFTPTTEQLRVVRKAALAVVSRVRRWQRRAKRAGHVGGIDTLKRGLQVSTPSRSRSRTGRSFTRAGMTSSMHGSPAPGSPSSANLGATTHDGGHQPSGTENGRNTPPPRDRLLATCKGVLPPPFFWNGQGVLVALASSLDFLASVPELVRGGVCCGLQLCCACPFSSVFVCRGTRLGAVTWLIVWGRSNGMDKGILGNKIRLPPTYVVFGHVSREVLVSPIRCVVCALSYKVNSFHSSHLTPDRPHHVKPLDWFVSGIRIWKWTYHDWWKATNVTKPNSM